MSKNINSNLIAPMKTNNKNIFFVLLGLILAVGIILSTMKVYVFYGDIKKVIVVKDELLEAVKTKETARIKITIDSTRDSVDKVKTDLGWLGYFSFLPGIHREVEIGRTMIAQAYYLLDSVDLAIRIVQDADLNLASKTIDLTSAEALKKIDLAITENKAEIIRLASVGDRLANLKIEKSRLRQTNELLAKIKDYVVYSQQAETIIGSSEDGLASFFGLRGEKKYLVLFENSDELRPGGGIISTYGLMTLKDGQVSNLFVDHVQNLGALYALPLELNPEPIQKTMRHQKNLYIYDANWLGDPNEWLQKIYTSWNEQKPSVDGVIVVSTKVLEDIVRQYEPMRISGFNQEFRAENVVASLDYYFDVEHDLYDFSKYKVLGPLVEQLIKNIKTSKPDQLKNILLSVKKRFQSRDLFVYTKDSSINDALEKNGIQNTLSVPQGDEFYPLGANLGSGKADGRLKRVLAMSVYAQDKQPFSMATIKQDYSAGKDDFRAGGYYGYLRFFLPLSSKLGVFDKFDLIEDENKIEAGRQVFSNYFSIATGEEKDLSITYALAKNVADDLERGKYSLTLRKQGGVEMPFEVKIYLPDGWKKPVIKATDGTTEFVKKQNEVVWKGRLTRDMRIEINR